MYNNSQALVARTHHPPFFSNFLFTNLFSIKFLYFFIISSLFPYFNLFVSIFIQSYVNFKLHVSTLHSGLLVSIYQGRIQDFKLGGAQLKKIAPSGGRRENFWGISCENSRFYAKKSRLQNLPPTPNLQF